jgi:hypothetical protein
MDKQALAKYVVDRLSAAVHRDDIIRYVCQRGRLDWIAAKAFVDDVEERHAREIDRRQIPINLTSAVMVGLFGLMVTAYSVLSIFEPLLGRPLPNALYLLNDFGVHYGLIPDPQTAINPFNRYDLLPDFWRTLYTVGQTYGVSHDFINILYVLAGGYFFWPLLLLGLSSLIVGSMDFFKNLFRITGK